VGRPDASREEIERAAQQAQAEEFIRTLPDGYDTLLGEGGVNLSGGQRQRLAIARAFLKDAPILILDEPTSALDAKTEAALLESLELLMRGRTTVIIAHRLSTLERADVIVVLDEGRIVEQGGRDELLSRDSAFRRFYCNGANSRRHGAALAET
jgi:ABC-type multidrug transport system fused ATPase/permease subunit